MSLRRVLITMISHNITGLYHGSLHQSNLKGHKVIDFLNTSQHGGGFAANFAKKAFMILNPTHKHAAFFLTSSVVKLIIRKS